MSLHPLTEKPKDRSAVLFASFLCGVSLAFGMSLIALQLVHPKPVTDIRPPLEILPLVKEEEEFVPPPEQRVRITHFGDIMLDRMVAQMMGKQGVTAVFPKTLTSSTLFDADIVTGNLEGPFADYRRETSKSIAFRFDPILAPQLRELGFTLFTLGNNHTLDMGYAGVEETEKHLIDAGISFYGSQLNDESNMVHYQEVDGIRLAFVGFNDTAPLLELDVATRTIAQATMNADWVIVNIHWGEEYKVLSNQHQRDLAHAFIDSGADLIIGHHPHVTQEVEVYNGAPIFYSLGNTIFDQYFSTETQRGLALAIEILEYPTLEKSSLHVGILPLQGTRSTIEFMEFADKETFIQALRDRSRLDGYDIVDSGLFIEYTQTEGIRTPVPRQNVY